MEYRRARVEGGTYFFTVVTEKRQKILCLPKNISLLRDTFRYVMEKHPFIIDAIVILPDHLHCIWTLPEHDHNFSTHWRLIKSYFSRKCETIVPENISLSRKNKKQRAIWQHRFWEHLIRDEIDFQNHVEYIHYNPVKHGLGKSPKDWEYSSFHRAVRQGIYDIMWGTGEDIIFDNGTSEGKTNHEEHEEKKISESSCVSPKTMS